MLQINVVANYTRTVSHAATFAFDGYFDVSKIQSVQTKSLESNHFVVAERVANSMLAIYQQQRVMQPKTL